MIAWLRRQSLVPVKVTPITALKPKSSLLARGVRVKSADMAAFCWQLTTMVEGGITVASAFDIIARDTEDRKFAEIIVEMSARMKKGQSFSEAAAEYPRTFNNLFCAMILVSETGGLLSTVLQRLAQVPQLMG